MSIAIEMKPVESSQIAAIGHDAATNTLAIQFLGKSGPGSLYHYQNFTGDDFAALQASESVGKHFYKHIKPFAEKHPYAKIDTSASALAAIAPATPVHHANRDGLAALLNGRQYREEMTMDEEATAKAAGLLVIFGASDDLMEFRGAVRDEIGAPAVALIDSKGLLPYREDIRDDDDALKDYFTRAPLVRAVDALWCKEPGYSWTFRTEIPHATFEILEGSSAYCRGIVIDMADLAPVTA